MVFDYLHHNIKTVGLLIIGLDFHAVPKMDKKDSFAPDRRLFSQLYMLKHLHQKASIWNNDFVKPLDSLITKYKDNLNLKCIGFPDNWKELLTK